MAKVLTFEEYQLKVKNRYGNRYTVLKYETTDKIALFRCNSCKRENISKNAGHIIYDKCKGLPYICKECDLKYNQKIKFEEKKSQILNGEYTFLEDYQGVGKKILVRHNRCGEVQLMNPDSLLENLKKRHTLYCSQCRPDKKKSTEEFTEELFIKSDGKLELVGEYKSARKSITVKCNRCNNEPFTDIADNVIRRLRCKYCDSERGKYRQKGYRYYYDIFCEKCDINEYIIDEKAIPAKGKVSAESKIYIFHKVCNTGKEIPLYDMLSYSCSTCALERRRLAQEEKFKKEFEKASQGEYELYYDVKYINNQTPMHMKHRICDFDFLCSRNHFISAGSRCPKCSRSAKQSKGERWVREILEEYGYLYSEEKYNEIFVGKNSYELDVQMINKNNELIAVVEYDGEQHFNPDNCFGMEKTKWERVVARDNERNAIAVENNIPLLRIPYIYDTKEAIEGVLTKFVQGDFKIPKDIMEYYSRYEFSTYGR